MSIHLFLTTFYLKKLSSNHVDVTLACDDLDQIQAHIFILSVVHPRVNWGWRGHFVPLK